MKPLHCILPALALGVSGIWNGTQLSSISTLEKEEGSLRRKIQMAEGYQSGSASTDPKKSPVGADGAIDWKFVADSMLRQAWGDGSGNLRDMLTLQQRLLDMSRDEMVAALNEIDGLGLSDDSRQELESMVVGQLAQKDPQYVLEKFSGQINNGEMSWHLANALRQWAKTDLRAATAWFDRKIAEGLFDSKSLDGRNEVRSAFEAALIGPLLGVDPTEAGNRLAAIPENLRREILEQLPFQDFNSLEEKNYANLVRNYIPADEREGSFAHIATGLAGEPNLDRLSTFLNAVQATPDERSAAAREAATSRLELLGRQGSLDAHAVDDLRLWLNYQAPGRTDTITGRALAEAAQQGATAFDYSDAVQLVLQYNRNSKNDEVLYSFLQGYDARSNLDQARELAEMLTNEARRKEMLARLK